ncbi:ABC transporter ATP-binding protein [Roseobacter denitrificans]|uniref:ABC transporter, ATP-binding protein, putative n=1 Tax=Roseobacter denitrificans (strain ATCC 33942 / OCh 114) TaxID=375451 RepID=Q167L3_ROSDO|nr:ABC transporter ATP-binding protein [Roseobacter denitrificans]ABG31830.1 ABC transporter, ATP-binding protein, putative [Roseobacter denitrificans OCh 114]AVL51392.1 ABC transporter ATP-binding protein [Roseobacter denitrificans]SFF86408.1 putative ABC transport system ATP-binding protein [Roseobacter denitrificans OCh 114]
MVLKVSHLAKEYETGGISVPVLRDVSFEVPRAGTLALEGESGSGKSTVLHLIAGLDVPTGGSIMLNGQEVAGLPDAKTAHLRRTTVGIIFQQFNLIPSLSVAANITFHARLGERYDPDWAQHVTEQIGLGDHMAKYPEALSGGQQQRVAIARTLAARPGLILADEPTGNLDEDTADTVLNLMLQSAAEAGAAVLMVTHSPRQAARMGRRIRLSHGVVQDADAPMRPVAVP